MSLNLNICIVPGCKTTPVANSDLRMHYLPSRNDIRNMWLKNMNREDLIPHKITKLKHYRVCRLHFKPTDYHSLGSMKLNRVAVPTILSINKDDQQENKINNSISFIPDAITEEVVTLEYISKEVKISQEANENSSANIIDDIQSTTTSKEKDHVNTSSIEYATIDLNNPAESTILNCKTVQALDEEYEIMYTLEEEAAEFLNKFKKVEFTFRGEMAPVFTPFTDDSTNMINFDLIPKYSYYLAEKEIRGVLVNGTSGEGMSLSVSERKVLAESWVKACKKNKQTVMVQVGGAPLPDVLELAKHAEEINADSILCLPELYNKPKNSSELIKYLSYVSKAAPNTPLLYYHIPSFTNVNINMPEFLKEANSELKNLVGIKFTSIDLVEGIECLRIFNGKYVIFLGADQLLAAAYTNGFDSAIATTFNIFPELGLNIRKSLSSGIDLEKLQSLQSKLTKNINNIIKYGSWVPTMKAAMNVVGLINVGPVREPLSELKNAQKDDMLKNLLSG